MEKKKDKVTTQFAKPHNPSPVT